MKRVIAVVMVAFVVGVTSFGLSVCPAHAQTEADLRATIERHYAAINGDDDPTVVSHHLPEMSIFNGRGHMLMDRTVWESIERVGAKSDFPGANVFINDFKAQIYGNVGVALFYLTGSYTNENTVRKGTWRVTAVWVHKDGVWKEAHHHESPLVAGNHP